MKHPTREAWVPFLFGEADPKTAKQLAEHLQSCPACAAELAGWRRSLKRLDCWRVPAAPPARTAPAPVLLKWAVAAALVLGCGFGWGRWSAPSAGQLKHELGAQWQTQFQAARHVFDETLARTRQEILDTSALQTRQALGQLAETLRAEQAEDQRAARVLYDTLQRQQQFEFIGLRKDLETVATRTDEEIRRARLQFLQFTSLANANENPNQ